MKLRVVPVIDLKDGLVVHARQGRRDSYRPISSLLCPSSDIHRVLEAFLDFYPFDTVYIADLNALSGCGNHDSLLDSVLQAYPAVDFWIDRGSVSSALQKRAANYRPVLGSESLTDALLPELEGFNDRFILSLDFFCDEPSGPQALFENSAWWPQQVIVMTLNRVGTMEGPDYRRLETYARSYPARKFIAAGGVRNRDDLVRLAKLGVERVLVASVLHAKMISAEDMLLETPD
jgi:phosphoribosylformimino-5-aminoimidazole carboxamide ribotide isomerase